jgi:hypothetical protein
MRAQRGWLIPVLAGLVVCGGCGVKTQDTGKAQHPGGTKQTVVEARDKMLEATRAALDDLEERANVLVRDAGNKTEEMKAQLGPKIEKAKEEFRKAGDAASDAWESARTALDKAMSDLDKAVRGQEPKPKDAKP